MIRDQLIYNNTASVGSTFVISNAVMKKTKNISNMRKSYLMIQNFNENLYEILQRKSVVHVAYLQLAEKEIQQG